MLTVCKSYGNKKGRPIGRPFFILSLAEDLFLQLHIV